MLAKLHEPTNQRREIYINARYVSMVRERFGKTEILVNAGEHLVEVQVSESVEEASEALNAAAKGE